VNAKKRNKAAAKARQRRRGTTVRTESRKATSVSIPRPRVTEYNEITVVPTFPGVEPGPPSGSPGSYEVVFVLGVPGVNGVATRLDFDAMLAEGDSLLQGSGLQMDIQSPDGRSPYTARVIPHSHGRLAQVRLTVTADDFYIAEKQAFDVVMSVLSRIAFEADAPVEVTGILLTEQATKTRRFGATIAGAIQPAPELTGDITTELRPFLAAYREGLNSNSPLYQALSFYKVIEGVTKFHTKRVRAARRNATTVPADPMAKQVPSDSRDLADMTDWARANFMPYLGKNFDEIRRAVEHTIRDAIAHITPGLDLRIADYAADIWACREVVPVLRYMARELIRNELAWVPSSGSSASTTAA
jgi:hypothetical protein